MGAPMTETTTTPRQESHASARRYLWIWLVLLGLTGLTYGLWHVELGSFAVPTVVGIATAKATLVALFFMHLYEQRGVNAMVLLVSLIFVALLIGLSVADVATRFPLVNPPGAAPMGTAGG